MRNKRLVNKPYIARNQSPWRIFLPLAVRVYQYCIGFYAVIVVEIHVKNLDVPARKQTFT